MIDDPWREIAKAARLRDWAAIDAIVEDKRICGSLAVRNGIADARKLLGLEPKPPQLIAPDPVTIHDLSAYDRSRAKISMKYGVPIFALPARA